MLSGLYYRTLDLAARPGAIWFLALVAFAESFIFPIPPDILLIPMALAARKRAFHIAAVCTVSSVLGGLAGYAVGAGLYQTLGGWLLDMYGYADAFDSFVERYHQYGAWIVFVAGVTPFPYKVITIASGTAGLDLATFTVASLAARGLRFFLVAALLYMAGPPIRSFIERRLNLVFVLFCVILVGGFVIAGLLS